MYFIKGRHKLVSYLDRIKTEKNTKTATTYTDKTDRSPFVSNVSDSSERILDKIDVQRVIQIFYKAKT